jgi:uncharacterized NAD(P)/FAD-binding protein YdhS
MSVAESARVPTVAVVGGGFSGLLTAIHLLARSDDVTVRLIERGDRFAAGRAYATGNPQHVLNVRAANMSAFPDRPGHFVEWLADQGVASGPDAFVSRAIYGEYLQDLLRGAVGNGAPGRLLLEHDEVVSIVPTGERYDLTLGMGRTITADAVVLAVGAGPPKLVPGAGPELADSPRYAADPWAIDVESFPTGEILLVGAGLTMVDTVLALARQDRRFLAVSRRGLAPHPHAPTAPAQLPDGDLSGARQTLRAMKQLAREAGWRSAVDGVRPITPAIWRGWSLAERRRFLRHARAWWDVHRHRMAPDIAVRVAELRENGRLEIAAARIEDLRPEASGVAARIRRRGAAGVEQMRFAAVVNCTGLSGDLTDAPLLRDLARSGRVRPDPLRLGLEVDDSFRAARGLYAVGPLARWARWETVAVPDLRSHTAEVAATVVADLGL